MDSTAVTGFFQRKKGSRPFAESSEPRLTLAAFGKHPGWDDHLPGIGVETEALAHVKQAFYVSGIGGQIDSAAWEKLEVDKRLEEFDHIFLWLRQGHSLVGQLWSSTDGKGRLNYPMVLCVDGEGVSAGAMLRSLRPGLDRLRDACKATTSADKVIENCRIAQEQIRAVLSDPSVRTAEATPPIEARREFLDRPELGPERLGLLRVLHELGSAPGVSFNGRPSESGSGSNTRSRHLRLPLASDSRSQSLLLWAAFLRCAVPESVPLLLMARRGVKWLDVVIGEPASDDLFCLQASTTALPLATEIPYEIAPELNSALQKLEAKFLELESGPIPHAAASPQKAEAAPAPRQAPPEETLAHASSKPPGNRKPWLFIGVALLLVIVAAWFWNGHRHKTKSQSPAPAAQISKADQDYQNAMSAAQQAWKTTNLDETINQTKVASEAKPGDADAEKLGREAQAAKEEMGYKAALNQAQSAFDRKDYADAIAKSQAVLAIRANDSAATKLGADAQAQLDSANALKLQEQKYQAAMKEGQAAMDRKDYASALRQASLALESRGNDAAASKLKAEAQAQIARNLKAQQDAEAAKLAQPGQTSKDSATPATPGPSVAGSAKKNRINELGMEFLWISKLPGGGAYFGKYEVTQKQFRAVMGNLPPEQAAQGDDLPVANVSIAEAKDFCDRLGKKEGKRYTLPSREEWLAVAGILPEQEKDAWTLVRDKGLLEHEVTSYKVTPLKQPAPVGSRGTQASGLGDLFGNVREWVSSNESAGFSFDTEGYGERKALFVTGDKWKTITGFRCILRDSD
jgi:formylglycine-generating enzyme required for sulfatase activity